MEIWVLYNNCCRQMREQSHRRGQGVIARKLIMEMPGEIELVANYTGLDIEEIRMEKDRLCSAWELVLEDYPDVEIFKTGIEPEEIEELKAMKRERRRLIFRALDNNLTPDMVQSFFDLSTAEMECWWDEWSKARREGIYG